MTAIIKCKVGKTTYLYESESYRDDNGNPRSKRKCIGRLDEKGNPVYNPEYLERVWGTERMPDIHSEKVFSVEDVKNSSIQECGVIHLLDYLSNTTGLLEALKSSMPKKYHRIMSLANFLLSTGDPAMYCELWLDKTDGLDSSLLTSQRISELLLSVTNEERMSFFEKWAKIRMEHEYFALDITSVSSYSELIGDVDYGYNRDGEKLEQINICLLLGEKSKLPIFQMMYNGSIKDVSTLTTTLSITTGLDLTNIYLIMDKGFASKKNIKTMLCDKNGLRFLVSLPFTMNFTKEMIESVRTSIDSVDNTFSIGSDVIRGVTKKQKWETGHKVSTFIYFNNTQAQKKRDQLFAYVADLKRKTLSGELDPDDIDIEKYLEIRKSNRNSHLKVLVRNNVIENELSNEGWMVAVSNIFDDAEEALRIYRNKDVVEKGFCRFKTFLNLVRLRVHSDEASQNKIFVGFIALILTAHIHKTMDDKNLYDKYTMKSLIKTLETLKVQYIKGKRILYPLTAKHKEIFSAFKVPFPV